MRRLALALLPVLWLWAGAQALAQQWLPGGTGSPIVCAYNGTPPTISTGNFIYAQCDTNGKLITSGGGGGGGTSSSFNSAFPATGTAAGASDGTNMKPLLVDGSGYLDVHVQAGGITGATSNATSGVATSSTNLPSVSWLYGFNGTTWDQLRSTGTPNFSLSIDDVSTNSQLHTDLTAPIAPQTAAAVPIGGSSICDGASTANPCAPAATVKAASTAAAAADKALVVAVSPNNPIGLPVNITEHDCSVTLTTGGTAQNAFAATATIHGFRIANVDTGHNDEVVWFSTTTTAAAGAAQSFPLPPPTATTYAGFGSYTSPAGEGVNTALSVVAATTSHVISCTYW